MTIAKTLSALLTAGLITAGQNPLAAAEPKQEFLIRNGLTQPVFMEITDSQDTHVLAKTTVNARWEMPITRMKWVEGRTYGVRLLDQAEKEGGKEIARCQSSLGEATQPSNVTVVVYTDEGTPHCSIVDLNAIQPIASSTEIPDTANSSNANKS